MKEGAPLHKTLDELKEIYKERLDDILNKELTIDNIETFADDALNKTIDLSSSLINDYQTNPLFQADGSLVPKDQEDNACQKLDLPNLPEILDDIVKTKEEIDELKQQLTPKTEETSEVITPPNIEDSYIVPGDKSEKMQKKKLFPRLLTLSYILQHDFDVTPDNLFTTQGNVTPNMMRENPYYRVEIPNMERVVYICDEEGNTSYVFDAEKLTELNINIEDIDTENKNDKNDLIKKHPGLGIRIIQSKSWRGAMSELLQNPIPERLQEDENVTTTPSEFKKKGKIFLSIEDFRSEARAVYHSYLEEILRTGEKVIKINDWYNIEQKKHLNWHSVPHTFYKNENWRGLSKIVNNL